MTRHLTAALAAYIRIDDRAVHYAVRIVRTTRQWPGLSAGAGPHGAIAMVRTARASALLPETLDNTNPRSLQISQ